MAMKPGIKEYVSSFEPFIKFYPCGNDNLLVEAPANNSFCVVQNNHRQVVFHVIDCHEFAPHGKVYR